jgi:CRISPR-associated exonuclease Cas4
VSASLWLAIALALVALGLASAGWARAQCRRSGFPVGEVVCSDTSAWRRCDKAFFSGSLGLTGKPDYLVEERGTLVPVEVKPNRDPEQPYEGDLLQLGAYCMLLEEDRGRAPPHGYLCYRNRSFRLAYSAGVKRQVHEQLQVMRCAMSSDDVAPNHRNARRCIACGHRGHCGREMA